MELHAQVPHPLVLLVEITTLVLTDEDGNAISIITSFTVRRSHLMERLAELDSAWSHALSSERPDIFLEITNIDRQWPYAPL